MSTVTILTPTIPGREEMLAEAMASVEGQTRAPNNVVIEMDAFRTGAARTRNRALTRVDTDYIAFLDDDDSLLPRHIETLMGFAEWEPEVDVIYPTPQIEGMDDPTSVLVNGNYYRPWGLEWTEDHRQHLIWRSSFIPLTCLVKTEAILSVGGFPEPGASEYKITPCEDWLMFRRLALKGRAFKHVNVKTWVWRKGDHHTGGQPAA